MVPLKVLSIKHTFIPYFCTHSVRTVSRLMQLFANSFTSSIRSTFSISNNRVKITVITYIHDRSNDSTY